MALAKTRKRKTFLISLDLIMKLNYQIFIVYVYYTYIYKMIFSESSESYRKKCISRFNLCKGGQLET